MATCLTVAAFGLPAVTAQAAESGTVPSPVADLPVLGGSGAADMYPSGLEVAPDGTVVVADTGDNEIEKYDAAGDLVWKVGTYGSGSDQFNNPRDIGIDSAGNIYVADTANTRIVKLSPTGSWLTSWRGSGSEVIKSPIGLSVSGDKVYVADGGTKKVRVYGTDGSHERSFSSNGSCTFSALRDVDADADGNVYVANYTLHNILKLTATGTCLTTWGSRGSGDGQFAAPYGVRLATDPVVGRQRVYVADSNNNRVQVFETDGAFVATMGSAGTFEQPGTFTQLRRVAVAADGDVWGADLWGWRLERFDRTSSGWTAAQRIGDTVPQLTDTAVFNEPRQIAVDTNNRLRVVDTVHHRLVTMTAEGDVLGYCGMRGSDDGELNWPRGVAVDTVTGQLWLADTKQSRIHVLGADCAPVQAPLGSVGNGADQMYWPMSLVIRESDRTAWIADTMNNRIVVWDVASRTALATFGTRGTGTGQFVNPRGIAVDPDTGNILVADRGNNRIVELSAGAGGAGIAVVRTLKDGLGLSKPEGVAVDGQGRIYVADTLNDRLVVLKPDGTLSGTTTGADGMADPASVTVAPGGRIYVSDTFNDRVLAFSWGGGGSADTTAPAATITSPANNASLQDEVTLAGGATDDTGATGVEVSITDSGNGLWWNGTGWQSTIAWVPTAVAAPGATSTTWQYASALAGGTGSYFAAVRAVDAAGNTTAEADRPTVRFTIATEPADTTDPDTTITAPTRNATLPAPVAVSGAATDNVGVTAVQTAVQDRVTKKWWRVTNGVGSWGSIQWHAADVASPGATSTAWSWSFTPTVAGSGSYLVTARGRDAAGLVDTVRPNTVFTVSSAPVDAADPDTAITSPTAGATVPSPVTVAGTASDDIGVTAVEVGIQDRDTQLWWNGSTWVSNVGSAWQAATLTTPGATSTGWSYTFTAPTSASGSARYWVTARAKDAAGKVDASRPGFGIVVTTSAPDAADPDTTITSPQRNAVLPLPVTVAGGATDDVGVTRVQVAVQDRGTRLWWSPATAQWTSNLGAAWADASVTAPGGTSVTWSWVFEPTGGSSSYSATARAVDAAGRVDGARPSLPFSVGADLPDYVRTVFGPGLSDLTPVDVAATATHYYALDVARYRIVKISRSSGEVVAEVGGSRGANDGDLAAARSIEVDSAGNVYIADTPNARVTKYDADLQFVTSFGSKGTGAGQFTQVYGLAIGQGRIDSGDATGEILYAVDGDGRLTRWTLGGAYIGTFAAGTALNQPRMAAVDKATNDLWVINARDRQVVVLAQDGTERFRFGSAGTGDGQFMGDPRGIAISPDGTRVFVSDEGNHRVQVFDPTGAYVGRRGATSTTAQDYLVDARGLDVAPDGTLVVSDEWDYGLKEWSAQGDFSRELFGTPAPAGGVNSPRGLALDATGRVYVSDWWNQRIQRIDADASAGSVLAWGQRGTRNDPGSINFAWDLAVQPGTGRVFLANRESHEIEVFTADGGFVTRWGNRGTDPGKLQFPHGVAFDRDGTLLVTDSANGRIQRFTIDGSGFGTLATDGVLGSKGTGPGQFDTPTGIAVAADGTLWVADTRNNRIQKRDPATGAWTVFTAPAGSRNFSVPWGVSVAPDGGIWVADSGNSRIVAADTSMNPLFVAGGEALGAGALNSPYEIEFGADGKVYVSDTFNNRVIELRR